MHTQSLSDWLLQLETDTSLNHPRRVRERSEHLDLLEAHFAAAGPYLQERIGALQANWEAIDQEVLSSIREEIRNGNARLALDNWFPELTAVQNPTGEEYDYLDDIFAGLFDWQQGDTAPEHPVAPEHIAYQPTPARHIFDLLNRLNLTADDTLVDIGSGLGNVSLLTAVWTKARAIGIEYEPTYVVCARQSATSLHLMRAIFIEQDVLAADLSEGTVFYLYTPFIGTVLRTALDRLRHEASTRNIRVCTFGPCTLAIAAEHWLRSKDAIQQDRVAIFNSVERSECAS